MLNKIYKYPITVIILICFTSRIPQLISPNLTLDGDECVVGLMAKHWFTGRDFQFYFWGQDYGFSLIEILFILPFYALFGISTISVKIAMLSLWTIGCIFLFKIIEFVTKNDKKLAFLLTILFISLPAWGAWSMKARGGYLTSFAASNLLIYLIFTRKTSPFLYISTGILLMLISESQPFWLVWVLPLVVFQLLKTRKLTNWIYLAATIIPIVLALKPYKDTLQHWRPIFPYIPKSSQLIPYFKRIPEYLFVTFHGDYFLADAENPNTFSALMSVLCVASIFLLIIISLYILFTKPKKHVLFLCSSIGIWCSIGYSYFTTDIVGRYLLPLSGILIFTIATLLNKEIYQKWISKILVTVTIFGFISVISFYSFQPHHMGKARSIQKLVKHLEGNKIYYVFSADCMLPYQIAFYSNEKILARMPYVPGRNTYYMRQVDNALKKHKKTALVSYTGELYGDQKKNSERVDDFLVLANPAKLLLLEHFIFQ